MLQAPPVVPFGGTPILMMISRMSRGTSRFPGRQETHPAESHTMLATQVVSDLTTTSSRQQLSSFDAN
jgi:hypothetical protein